MLVMVRPADSAEPTSKLRALTMTVALFRMVLPHHQVELASVKNRVLTLARLTLVHLLFVTSKV
jgi:hypothetical protein